MMRDRRLGDIARIGEVARADAVAVRELANDVQPNGIRERGQEQDIGVDLPFHVQQSNRRHSILTSVNIWRILMFVDTKDVWGWSPDWSAKTMFHLTSPAWLVGTNSHGEDPDRMDHVALHEARIATDFREHRAEDLALARSLERRRARTARSTVVGSLPDLAGCPA